MLRNFGKKNVHKIKKMCTDSKEFMNLKNVHEKNNVPEFQKIVPNLKKKIPFKQIVHMFQKMCAILKNVRQFEKKFASFFSNLKNVHNFKSIIMYLKIIHDLRICSR